MRNNMIGRMALPIMVAGFFTLASCDKEDVKNPQQPAAAKLTEFRSGEDFVRFEYNADGSVKKLTLNEDPVGGDENVSFTVAYDANKKPSELTGSNGTVVRTTYANGKLTKAEMFAGPQRIAKTDYTYEGNVLKEVTGYLFFDNADVPFFKASFVTAASGNISRTNGFIFDPVGLDVVPAGHVNLQYDSKPNPLASVTDLMLIFWQVATPNNVIKEEHFDEQNQAQEVIERTYTYNNQGYPIRATVKETAPGEQPVNSTITYSYK